MPVLSRLKWGQSMYPYRVGADSFAKRQHHRRLKRWPDAKKCDWIEKRDLLFAAERLTGLARNSLNRLLWQTCS
jgi:hypothetical protein